MDSRASPRKRAVCAASCPYALTMRCPARFSCAIVDRIPSCSWIFSKRSWIRLPKPTVTGGSSRRGIRETSVIHGSITVIRTMANTPKTTVLTRYMYAGPATIRTAAMSLVARDMISPVGLEA